MKDSTRDTIDYTRTLTARLQRQERQKQEGCERIAALVALCEEVLDAYDDLPLPDSYRNPDNFRERLAQLKGEG